MEIDLQRVANEVGTRAEETSSNQPLPESQIDSGTIEKVAKVWEVSVERIKDSPPKLQLEGMLSEIVELVIEPPHDPVE